MTIILFFADVKVSVPLNPSAGKSKRHAGVERPSALRIEDFEDVESPHEVVTVFTYITELIQLFIDSFS